MQQPRESEPPSAALKMWHFNDLFARYSLDDAVRKACDMEVERANWSQLPLLQDVYRRGWHEWKEMPGAQAVQDLIEWDFAFKRDNQTDPCFPKIFSNSYIWKGELTPKQVADIELYSFGPNDNAHNTTNYSVLKAWLGGERDLSDLASWWAFDEATHKEMKLHMLTNHLGFTREQLFSRGDQTRELLKNEKTVEIDKEALRTATRFLAMRDGPAMLCGAMALLERENVWTTQTNWRAYRDIYKFPNEAMVPINVHTYIDLFHVRIGEYIVGKYADTKEKQEMIKTLYQSQKMKQFEMSKQYYGKVLQGQSVSIGLHDADGNMA